MKEKSDTLISLLETMVRIRLVDEKIIRLYPRRIMRCPVHLSIGQEAVAAGVCKALIPGDMVFSSHRTHGYYIATGGDISAMMAELLGKSSGCCSGKGGSQHLSYIERGFLGSSAIVAGTIPIAVGAAMAARMQGKKQVTVVDFGDGAADQGVFYESLNFAALHRIPVVFICENNLYATHAHQSARQANPNIFEKASSFNIPSMRIDGNDAVSVYRHARTAVAHARSGGGPFFLECMTYRWYEHVGVHYDYELGYRAKDELVAWKARCPIKKLKAFLLSQRYLKPSDYLKLVKVTGAQISQALEIAQKSSYPGPDEALKDVYYEE
jgi:acetoin:2,6-dichlorophenolindophenol oxidoreductase subunit alpha